MLMLALSCSLPVEVASTILVASLVVYAGYLYIVDPLSHIPRLHWSSPLSRVHHLCMIYLGTRRQIFLNAHLNRNRSDGFRPLIRVGPKEVSIMTSDGVRSILGSHFERGSWYAVFRNFDTENMFSSTSGKEHGERRRIYARDYSKTTVSSSHIQNLIKRRVSMLRNYLYKQSLQSYMKTTAPFIVGNLFRALQADILTAFAFGEPSGTNYLGALNESERHTLDDLGMGEIALFIEEERGQFFFWESEEPFISFSRLISPKISTAHKMAETWVSNMISNFETRITSSCSSEIQELFDHSIYGKLLKWNDGRTATQLSWNERASEIMDHIGAGLDSVSLVLEYSVCQLCRYPQLQSRLQTELSSRHLAEISEATYADIDALPFLSAVVLESLRLVGTIESCQTRIVPKGGYVVEGYHLPAQTIVSCLPYLLHRQEDVFPDPEYFNPDRWLVDEEELKVLLKSLLTFSSGSRACIGKDLALAVIKVSLATLYSTFSTRSEDGDKAAGKIRFQQIA